MVGGGCRGLYVVCVVGGSGLSEWSMSWVVSCCGLWVE